MDSRDPFVVGFMMIGITIIAILLILPSCEPPHYDNLQKTEQS